MQQARRFVLSGLLVLTAAACQSQPEVNTVEPDPWRLDGRIVDLTHAFDESTVYWPTATGFQLTSDFEGMAEGGYFYEANSFSSAEHGGTHLDAPVHFAEGRQSTDEVPLERLIGRAAVIDVSESSEADSDYLVRVDDIERWEAENGRLPDGIILLFHTGFGSRWPDAAAYLGTAERGESAVSHLHFPGIHPDTARWLVEHRSIGAIGIDTASIDYGQSKAFESHRILYEQNIPGFENVANLDQLPSKDFLIVALPMKIGSGSGGPLRIVAIVPE